MSQEKVDRYKEYKKNKDKILKKRKRSRIIELVLMIAIVGVLAAWLIVSAVQTARNSGDDSSGSTVTATEVDMNAYETYINSLQTSFSA